MALINLSYLPPGVYTNTIYNPNTAQLSPSARVPVLIGEGPEFFTNPNVELHRGSSSTADDKVGEDLSDQANGTRNFQLTYFPVVTGDGTGTVTNDPTKISVVAGGLPVNAVSLNGKTGQFSTQTVVPEGTPITVQYFFKKGDTLVTSENLSSQIPTFATLVVGAELTLSLSIPGALGNSVSFALTQASSGAGVTDSVAVTGNGTDVISIELRNSTNGIRSFNDLAALVQAGIQTVSGGYLSATITGATPTLPAAAQVATFFAGGSGQSTNQMFKTAQVPIVDGTNGGVVTTTPSAVTVKVNGAAVTVTAVDGATGLITLGSGVAANSTLEVTYYTNHYQDTSDLLPSANVASILSVGYGMGRSDFIEGVDFVLNGNSISWGAAVSTAAGQETDGFIPFDGSVVTTTLVDQKMYLVPVAGTVSGRNSVFALADTPVDGSGLGIPTDDVSKISVYVGTNPVTALTAGPVLVSRLSGASGQVTLYNPPALGQNVYASYYRSVLNDHEFTLTAKISNGPGQGSYTVADELGDAVASVVVGPTAVTNANFATTGLVWPNNFPDLMAGVGAADETVTLTFQNDALANFITQPVQASLTVNDGAGIPRIKFTAVTPGVAGNTVTVTLVAGGTGAADAAAIVPVGLDIVVETVKADNTTVRTWQDIVTLFATYPVTLAGVGSIIAAGVAGADLTSQSHSLAATPLTGGAALVSTPYANRFLVTTSRTAAQAALDGLGLTGGATTPVGTNTTLGAVGYLGQTYDDPTTALQFTIVDPKSALSYGYTQLPSPSYGFAPGDKVTFIVSSETGFITGSKPTIALPGLQTKVTTTLGMNTGDSAIVSSFNRSGKSPSVGDFYYVSYTTNKTATDYAVQVFSDPQDAYVVYGLPSISNRLALAIQLMTENGASQFACIQVPVQVGLPVASDQAFIDAIQTLAAPLPSSGRRVNVIVPLSTSPTVHQFLSTFLTKQATARNKGEAIGFVGFDQFATPAMMGTDASSIYNQRMIAVAPNALGISLQGPTDLAAIEYAVTGEFLAAALAGLNLAPTNDVATTLTNQVVVGFTRSLVSFDETTKNLLAINGVTVLNDLSGALTVRHYKTTNPSNALTSEPYITTTVDFINQSFRSILRQFIGRKQTTDLVPSITAVLNAQLAAWTNDIITANGELVVALDPTDPTTINISVPIRPMFSLLYINITLTVNISM